jgi:hypothetical protein
VIQLVASLVESPAHIRAWRIAGGEAAEVPLTIA